MPNETLDAHFQSLGLKLGPNTLHEIVRIISDDATGPETSVEVRGKNLSTGKPKTVVVRVADLPPLA